MNKLLELRSRAALEIPENADGGDCCLCGDKLTGDCEHMKVASLHRKEKSLQIRWDFTCRKCADDFKTILTMLKWRRDEQYNRKND